MSKKKDDDYEESVLEEMTVAQAMAERVFGDNPAPEVVLEIYDWIQVCPDEKTLEVDLKRVYEYSKILCKTEMPPFELVLGIFDRIFGED